MAARLNQTSFKSKRAAGRNSQTGKRHHSARCFMQNHSRLGFAPRVSPSLLGKDISSPSVVTPDIFHPFAYLSSLLSSDANLSEMTEIWRLTTPETVRWAVKQMKNESLEHCSIPWDDCGMWFSGLQWDYGRVPQDDFMNYCGDKVTVAMDLWNWDSHNITVVGVYFGKTDLWRGVLRVTV